MFGSRYFGRRFWGGRFWGAGSGAGTSGGSGSRVYWGRAHFGGRYWGARYFPGGTGAVVSTDPVPAVCGNDLLRRGMAALAAGLQRSASQPCVFKRGTAAVALCATFGRTLMKLDDGGGGVRMEWTDRDFLVPSASLTVNGVVAAPERGDLFKTSENGVLYTYEVFPYGGEPPWRRSDPYGFMLRVHTKLVAEAPA